MPAELHVSPAGDAGTLLVAGEVDTHTSEQLHQHLADLDAGTHVVLDLSSTTFISSAGLSVILNAQRRHDEAGGSLRVAAPTPAVARVIELSGLAEQLGLD